LHQTERTLPVKKRKGGDRRARSARSEKKGGNPPVQARKDAAEASNPQKPRGKGKKYVIGVKPAAPRLCRVGLHLGFQREALPKTTANEKKTAAAEQSR